jgi:hypothetical protein
MILREQIWFSVSKFIEQIFAHNKFAHCEQILWAILFSEQFFADFSSKIITLADPVLSQPDMERKWYLLRPARTFPHSRFTTYCRTFLYYG